MPTVHLTCGPDSFRPADTTSVRWLEWDADFEMARRFWPAEIPLSRSDWDECRALGYRYVAVIQDGFVLALAAEYRFSEDAWMLAGVRTLESHRRLGLAKKVAASVTESILSNGRLAICETATTNTAMLATARALGYQVRRAD